MLRVRTVGDATCVYRTLTLVSRLCRDRLSLAPRLMSHVCCLVCNCTFVRDSRHACFESRLVGRGYMLHPTYSRFPMSIRHASFTIVRSRNFMRYAVTHRIRISIRNYQLTVSQEPSTKINIHYSIIRSFIYGT